MPRATKSLSDAESLDRVPMRAAAMRRLIAANVKTLGDLCSLTPRHLGSFKHIGPVTLAEIRAGLSKIGRTLKEDAAPTSERTANPSTRRRQPPIPAAQVITTTQVVTRRKFDEHLGVDADVAWRVLRFLNKNRGGVDEDRIAEASGVHVFVVARVLRKLHLIGFVENNQMDPNACWAAIVAAISNPDREEVDRGQLAEDLRNLAEWIARGGVLPNVYQ